MKKVGKKIRLRASTRKSIRVVCTAKTIANRDTPLKTQNNNSRVSKRSSVRASRRSQSVMRKSKIKRKRVSVIGKAMPPSMSAAPAGLLAPQFPVKGTQYPMTPPGNLDKPEMEQEMSRQGNQTADAGAPDFIGFCFWIFSGCGLFTWCCGDEDTSAESVCPELVGDASAAPVKFQKMQGSPLKSSQGKGKNMSVFKQQQSIQQQQFRSTAAQGAYY